MEQKVINPVEAQPAGGRKNNWLLIGMIGAGVLLMLVAVFGLSSLNRAQAGQVLVGPPRVGYRMANFALRDVNGNLVKLSDFNGHPILINTWATWCPPCRAEMPDLNTFYQKYRSRGLVILAINAGETRDLAAGFANQLQLTFPILLDSDERLVDNWGIHDFPTSILIGRDGVVQTIHIGMFTPDTLDQEIAPLIQ